MSVVLFLFCAITTSLKVFHRPIVCLCALVIVVLHAVDHEDFFKPLSHSSSVSHVRSKTDVIIC